MNEIKGKLETTYEWTCDACEMENRVCDAQLVCAKCGKLRTEEKYLRHLRLTPTPFKFGIYV